MSHSAAVWHMRFVDNKKKTYILCVQSEVHGVEELDLNPTEHLWDELEWRMQARPSPPTSVSDLTNTLLDEWAKIPTDTLQNLVESLPRSVEAVKAAQEGPALH